MQLSWKKYFVSKCETHHVYKGQPAYGQRFLRVLDFHDPGIAAVQSETGCYHINLQGQAIYDKEFKRTFGFYDKRAAVEDQDGWFHINISGLPEYPRRYAWCGNYQESVCVVKDHQNNFFHINLDGEILYLEKYAYAGDFKGGIAVISTTQGLSTHIDTEGKFIHGKWFDQLDVFHKGFARARDHRGWFHIQKDGNPVYQERYAAIEPFYNGIAYGELHKGMKVLVNEQGQTIQKLVHY